jgi:DNA-binding transcriptional regulator YdaS (Cro superfamily)
MIDTTITPFAAWMRAATSVEQIALAERIGSTRETLYQYSTGHRQASVDRAAQIEEATREMSKASKGRLPVVLRTDLVPACRACPYALKCLGAERVLASEFPIVQG